MEKYENLDGLRIFACIGIISMHIAANADYTFGEVGETIISSFTHFVPMFLIVSGFGMSCGYYQKIRNGKIDFNIFYTKRYLKILPFFSILIFMDLVIDRSFSHILEGITELTLVFGLLPNNSPNVIGVCWTLGVIFLFYIMFPFVVFLCWSRIRTIISLIVSIIISFICSYYYFSDNYVVENFVGRTNFLYCAPWFLGGVFLYQFRSEIKKFVSRFRWPFLVLCVGATCGWYFVPDTNEGILMLKNLIVFLLWISYAISVKSFVLNNRITRFLGTISFEMYLAQMVVFRILEKLHLLYIFGNGWFSFILVSLIEIIILVAVIKLYKLVEKRIMKRIDLGKQ